MIIHWVQPHIDAFSPGRISQIYLQTLSQLKIYVIYFHQIEIASTPWTYFSSQGRD